MKNMYKYKIFRVITMTQEVLLTNTIKENTLRILKEIERQSPTHFQLYSDMYKEYIHILDNMFTMLSISEKEIKNKINIDDSIISNIGQNTKGMTETFLEYIDNYREYLHMYAKTHSEMVNTYNKQMHTAIGLYTQFVSNSAKWFNTYNNNIQKC